MKKKRKSFCKTRASFGEKLPVQSAIPFAKQRFGERTTDFLDVGSVELRKQ